MIRPERGGLKVAGHPPLDGVHLRLNTSRHTAPHGMHIEVVKTERVGDIEVNLDSTAAREAKPRGEAIRETLSRFLCAEALGGREHALGGHEEEADLGGGDDDLGDGGGGVHGEKTVVLSRIPVNYRGDKKRQTPEQRQTARVYAGLSKTARGCYIPNMGMGAQIRGPHREGSGVIDEGDLTRAVAASLSRVEDPTADGQGQAAAAAVLPLRRRLWALAETWIPERLAAALRARATPSDPSAHGGVRELRLAIAAWLDPPPVCRWCRRPLGPTLEVCPAARHARGGGMQLGEQTTLAIGEAGTRARARRRRRACVAPRYCRPGPSSAATRAERRARCGTLALYSVTDLDLATRAAALAIPKGAAATYDVAADRDCRALLAATCLVPPHPLDEPDRWSSPQVHAIFEAVSRASTARNGAAGVLPPALLAARDELQRARNENVRINGRIALAVQRRYYAPDGGARRADLLQGAAEGLDRAARDYDAAKAGFATYAATWARQGAGDRFHARDLVGAPPWLHALRRSMDAAFDVVAVRRALDTLVETASVHGSREKLAPHVCAHALDLAAAAGIDTTTLVGVLAASSLAWRACPKRHTIESPTKAQRRQIVSGGDEDLDRARERVCEVLWPAAKPGAKRVPGKSLLAALRHGAPVFVEVGSGEDVSDDTCPKAQAEILIAPDEAEAQAEEEEDRARWSVVLAGLAELRRSAEVAKDVRGLEAAEIVRRYHGLDSVAEEGHTSTGGPCGESFARIGANGLHCSGRRLTGEAVRRIYRRSIELLRSMAAGTGIDLGELGEEEAVGTWAAPAGPVVVAQTAKPPAPREAVDGGKWDEFRAAAAATAW